MAVASPLNLIAIRQGIRGLGVAVTRAQVSANRSAGILLNRTKIKSKLVFGDRRLFQKRRDAVRRKRQESIIEASTIGGAIGSGASSIANTAKGFLGRIMDFLGTLLLGWMLNNLPTIISMAQELMGRIQRLVSILGSFVTNIGRSLLSFGNVLGAIAQNISSFDFLDSSNRVENAMNELNSVFDDMGREIDEGMKLLKTPLTEGLTTGEDAAPFGTDYTTQPGEGKVGGSPDFWTLAAVTALEDGDPQGRADVAQSIYNRAASGVFGSSSLKAIILSGNGKQYEPVGRAVKQFQSIQDRESAIKAVMAANKLSRPQAEKMIDDTVSAITNPTLKRKAAEFVENRTDFLGAGLTPDRESSTPLRRRNPSDNIFGNYVGPASYQYGLKSKGQAATANLQLPDVGTPAAKMTPSRGVTTTVKDELDVARNKSSLGGLTPGQGFGAYRTSSRRHAGIDIGTYGKRGFYVAFKQSGTVTYAQNDGEGYGNLVIIKVGNTEFYFAHLAKIMVKSGQPYNGQTIGEIGKTGGNYDIHLHFEARPGGKAIDPKPYLGFLSIGRQLTGMSGQPTQVSTTGPAPAQIATRQTQRQQLPSQLTRERRGPQVVLIDDTPPPMLQIPSAPSSGMMLPMITGDPLNSFIKNKLLLDLAYT
jgi:murein DD-endopeptidase MepM/ murein hydrolase activator NlpD